MVLLPGCGSGSSISIVGMAVMIIRWQSTQLGDPRLGRHSVKRPGAKPGNPRKATPAKQPHDPDATTFMVSDIRMDACLCGEGPEGQHVGPQQPPVHGVGLHPLGRGELQGACRRHDKSRRQGLLGDGLPGLLHCWQACKCRLHAGSQQLALAGGSKPRAHPASRHAEVRQQPVAAGEIVPAAAQLLPH